MIEEQELNFLSSKMRNLQQINSLTHIIVPYFDFFLFLNILLKISDTNFSHVRNTIQLENEICVKNSLD